MLGLKKKEDNDSFGVEILKVFKKIMTSSVINFLACLKFMPLSRCDYKLKPMQGVNLSQSVKKPVLGHLLLNNNIFIRIFTLCIETKFKVSHLKCHKLLHYWSRVLPSIL